MRGHGRHRRIGEAAQPLEELPPSQRGAESGAKREYREAHLQHALRRPHGQAPAHQREGGRLEAIGRGQLHQRARGVRPFVVGHSVQRFAPASARLYMRPGKAALYQRQSLQVQIPVAAEVNLGGRSGACLRHGGAKLR